MLSPAKTGSGVSVLVTARSASVLTVVVAVPTSFAVFGSGVVLDPVAVLVIVDPPGVVAATATTISKVALAPAARVTMVQLTVPVPPTAGVMQVKDGPKVCVSETNVV